MSSRRLAHIGGQHRTPRRERVLAGTFAQGELKFLEHHAVRAGGSHHRWFTGCRHQADAQTRGRQGTDCCPAQTLQPPPDILPVRATKGLLRDERPDIPVPTVTQSVTLPGHTTDQTSSPSTLFLHPTRLDLRASMRVPLDAHDVAGSPPNWL